MNIPTDPVILLSYINTKLRDYYSSLDAFCEDTGCDKLDITAKLSAINYIYDEARNQFVQKCHSAEFLLFLLILDPKNDPTL